MSENPSYDELEKRVQALTAELRKESDRLKNYLDAADVMILVLNQNGEITFANHKSCEVLEISESEIIGKNWFHHFIPPDAIEEVRTSYQRVLAGHNGLVEYRILTKNLTEKTIAWHQAVLKTEAGQTSGTLSSGQDIAERKQPDTKLQNLHAKLTNALEIAQLGPWEYDVAKDLFIFNDYFYKVFHTTAEQVGGYTMSSAEYARRFVHPDDIPIVGQKMRKAIEAADPSFSRQLEHRILYADGMVGYLTVRFFIVKDAHGQTIKTYGVNQDITERKLAERERLASLKFFESMDKVNRAIQRAKDLDSMLSEVLDVILDIFNCDRSFLLFPLDPEAPFWSVPMERTRPEYPGVNPLGSSRPMEPSVALSFRTVLNSPGPVQFGPGSQYSYGETAWERFGLLSELTIALHPKIGKPWRFGLHQCAYARIWTADEETLFQEIGRRLSDGLTSMLMDRDLRKSEEFLDSIIENLPNMVFVKDPQTLRFVRFNKAGELLSGKSREEIIGKTDYDLFPKESADVFAAKDREALSTKKLVDIPEERIRDKSNTERILHTKKIPILDQSGAPKYLLGISEDITERKKLEDQLRQSQKMEAVGQLAGGIAHDFNNMLGVIHGYAELALIQMAPSHPNYVALCEIRKAAGRSADLTRQLLAFARKQTIAPKVLDLNETVEGMLKMLRRLIGEHIDLAWLPGPGVLPIKMDPSQIDQLLANLCVNARDAIAGVGKVTIETHAVCFDEAYCTTHPGFSPGEFVMLAVSDDGCGMDQDILGKLFEPFFTTKGLGQGTGLGLAMVYGIIKQNNGFINVYSEPHLGTCFKIYLPRFKTKTDQMGEQIAVPQQSLGHETILLVEDEPAILDIAKLMLERLTYHVLAASTPIEALQLVKEHAGQIHLLITDVVMPEMNGRDLVKSITALYPKIRHLYMSGYTSNVIAHHGVLDKGVHYIQKPFSIQALAAKVYEMLHGQ